MAAGASSNGGSEVDTVVPVDLQTENTTELLGTDDERPELSWQLRADGRNVTQAAYRVLVSSTPEKLADSVGDVWDSGKTASASPRATYDGSPLESGERYYWKVRVWTEDGAASDWSKPTWWEMGLLDAEDWSADWIRYPEGDDFEDDHFRLARREFDLPDKSITRARAYISAGHQYQLHLNGEAVDKGPSFHYPDRQYYKTKDVTDLLKADGANAVAALYNWNGPGQGRPEGEPGLIVQLTVEYADGTSDTVTTDGSWRVRDGPWLDAGERNGDMGEPIEVIDGREVPQGWTETGFDDNDWLEPEIVGEGSADSAGPLHIENRYLQVTGGGVTLSAEGDNWSDYTYALDVRQPTDTDARPATGFVFRAPDEDNGYMWQLGSEAGTGELRLHVQEDGEYTVLDSVSVDAEPGTWHRIEVELSGSQIRTYLEGELVDERTDDTFSGGHVGFREASGEIGEFDNVTVTAADGDVLLEDDFSSGFDVWQVPPTVPWTTLQSQEREIVRNAPITPESITEKTGGNLHIVDGHLQVRGGGVTLSAEGNSGSDYTYALNVRQPTDTDAQPAAGFVFRAQDADNCYMWQLGSKEGTGQIRLHVRQDGDYEVLDTIPVDAEPGTWYRIEVELSGSQIRTYFEGELVDERTDDTFSSGRVGFREASGEVGEFNDVRVTSATGDVLLADDFSDSLDDWEVPHVYVADFGRVVSGLPRVHFAEGETGRRVDMRAGYLLTDDGRVAEERGTQNTDMRYGYVQRDGEQMFEPFLYLGFRYFQIEDPGEELTADQIQVATRYNEVPDEHAATFSSSNETLDAVWELARHSALHGSQEQFVDTPTREKGQFLGDAFNISWTTMQAFGERKLSQQAIREFIDSQRRYWSDTGRLNSVYPNGDGKRDIPDYTEKFPEWVWQYYLVTGDQELLAEAYPVVQNVADYVARHVDDETQLVTNLSGGSGPYKYGIVDWPAQMRYGYDMDTAARTTVNALGANVFRRTAQMADALDRPDTEAAAYREHEATIREGMNTHLLRDDGVYVDGLKSDGSQSSHVSQHANAFSIALDLVPDHAVESVTDRVASEGVKMGPMTIQWLLYALADTDRYDALLDVITNPDHDGWADILDRGGTFTWESWVAREHSEGQSLSHPWGATVLIGIQKAFLGVSIKEPGSSHVEIEPPSSALTSAAGKVPTERGTVDVTWERTETSGASRTRDGIVLSATVPANTTATVRIPTFGGERVRVRESEKTIWNNGNQTGPGRPGIRSVQRDEDVILVEVGSGEYRFELEQIGQ